MIQEDRYRDFTVDLNVHPIKGDLLLNRDAQAIGAAIKNLILTNNYERFWHPNKGAGIPKTLFENMDADTQYVLENRIREVIETYEPRAEINYVTVAVSHDMGEYTATVDYTPVNALESVTVDIIFRRVR